MSKALNKKEMELAENRNKAGYISLIYSMISNLIVATGLPEELEDDFDYFLIKTLIDNSGFIVKGEDGLFHYAHGETIDPYDDMGFGRKYIVFNEMGKEWRGTLNENGCVVRPFSSRRRINLIRKTSEELAEIDTSTTFLIKWARVAPFLVGNDNKQKQALLDVVKSVMEGNLTPMISENILPKLFEGDNSQSLYSIDLMQPERIRDLQYLTEYKEHVIKELLEVFGIPFQISTKMAQQSKDEINSGNGACYIIPMDILKNFRKFARNLNKTFGLNVEFNLNVLILSELEKYFNQEGENHETGENIRDELTGSEHTDSEHISGDGGNGDNSGED